MNINYNTLKMTMFLGIFLMATVFPIIDSAIAKRYVNVKPMDLSYEEIENGQGGDDVYTDGDEFRGQILRGMNRNMLRNLAGRKRGAPLRFGRGQPLRFG